MLELAAEIAANAPLSLEGNKRVIRSPARARPLGEEVERELIELRESCFRSEDFREGVRAFAEKRKPALEGPLRQVSSTLRPTSRAYLRPRCRRSSPTRKRSRSGEIDDHAEIEALVERAWQVRVERFGDSTDMCSLVNAKSGGCAEDCGFCAQSRFAEADTPMHAMMTPEQILEHARAAEAAGAHRFCMVTQGQGLSKRDFQNVLEGAQARGRAHQPQALRLDRPHVGRARARRSRRPASSGSTTTSRRPRATTPRSRRTVRYEGRLRTIEAVKEAGLETCVGGILNLGESPEQRVEMAFQLAKIDPTSVPINLLNPRPGTKFGDRDYMDPWEAVKWIAIFRLILPDGAVPALRRAGREPRRAPAARGQGRHQRRDDGQLPDHARLRARGRPRDVRGARAEHGAPGRQRLEPAAGQPLRLARRRHARAPRSTS